MITIQIASLALQLETLLIRALRVRITIRPRLRRLGQDLARVEFRHSLYTTLTPISPRERTTR